MLLDSKQSSRDSGAIFALTSMLFYRPDPASCASLAGTGCSGRDGGDDFTGSEACCGGGVRALGRVCSAEVGAPCVVEEGECVERHMY